jgi:hypothetical protein
LSGWQGKAFSRKDGKERPLRAPRKANFGASVLFFAIVADFLCDLGD